MIQVKLPDQYDLTKDEVYMSPNMLNYFKNKLENMRQDILEKEHTISLSLMDNPNKEPDFVDRAVTEELIYDDFMFQEHEHKILIEINAALALIEEGSYGYCQETGEAIGIKRLESVPTTKYSLEAQKKKEKII
jgi:DnaK suppressor protein